MRKKSQVPPATHPQAKNEGESCLLTRAPFSTPAKMRLQKSPKNPRPHLFVPLFLLWWPHYSFARDRNLGVMLDCSFLLRTRCYNSGSETSCSPTPAPPVTSLPASTWLRCPGSSVSQVLSRLTISSHTASTLLTATFPKRVTHTLS